MRHVRNVLTTCPMHNQDKDDMKGNPKMSIKRKTSLLGDLFAGNSLVKLFKFTALIAILGGIGFAVAILVTSREGFGIRGFLAYAGVGLITGIVIFELAEIIRWLQTLNDRFDLYDKKVK